jgi:hypothetical protein
MRHLLALLDGGTRGTSPEPMWGSDASLSEAPHAQRLSCIGTLGTLGTLANDPPVDLSDLPSIAAHVVDLVDAWYERMAICLEAGDIGEAEAEITAALEVGRAFVRNFVHDQRGNPS